MMELYDLKIYGVDVDEYYINNWVFDKGPLMLMPITAVVYEDGDYDVFAGEDSMKLIQSAISKMLGVIPKEPSGFERFNEIIYNSYSTDAGYAAKFLQPDSVSPDIAAKAKSIVDGLTGDYEKLRAIHDWVAGNIMYDFDLLPDPPHNKVTAEYTFKHEASVCAGYAALTSAMCQAVGIPCRVASGFAAGIGSDEQADEVWEMCKNQPETMAEEDMEVFIEDSRQFSNHDWNEAYVDGRWVILDTTWDSNNDYSKDGVIIGGSETTYFDPDFSFFSETHLIEGKYYNDFEPEPEPEGDVEWTVNDGVVTVTGTGNMPDWDGYEESPFYNDMSIASVVVEEGVTGIGDYAFQCCFSVESISLPQSLKTIGEGSFVRCSQYSSSQEVKIDLPNVTSIGEGAFSSSGITELTLGSPFVSIDYRAFCECENLRSVVIKGDAYAGDEAFDYCINAEFTFGGQLTKIGREAFADCWKLREIPISSKIRRLGEDAFWNSGLTTFRVDEDNPYFSIENGVLMNKNKTRIICYPASSDGEEYTVPSSVTYIENGAFSGADSLQSIRVAEGNANYADIDGVLCAADRKTILIYPSGRTDAEYTVPDGVETLGGEAFDGCAYLQSINAPGVREMGNYAIKRCDALQTAIFGDNLKSMGEGAFYKCGALRRVELGNKLERIEDYAFRECAALYDLALPESLTYIGANGFYGTGMYNAYNNNWKDSGLYIGSFLVFIFDNEAREFTVKPGTTLICEYCFWHNKNLEEITLPGSLKYINYGAFTKCSKLNRVNYEGGDADWNAITVEEGNYYLTEYPNIIFNHSMDADAYHETHSGLPMKYYGIQTNDLIPVCRFDRAYSGEVSIEFDLKINELSDGVISFSNQNTVFGKEAIAIHTKPGVGIFAKNGDGSGNGDDFVFDASPTVGGTYHFELVTETMSHTWSGTVLTPKGETVTVADNFGYRTEQDFIDRAILVRNTDDNFFVDDVEVTNLTISAYPEIAAISAAPDEQGRITVTVDTINVSSMAGDAQMMAVGIGDAGEMLDISPVSHDGTASLDGENIETVKVFCWESLQGMKPLCPAKEVVVAR